MKTYLQKTIIAASLLLVANLCYALEHKDTLSEEVAIFAKLDQYKKADSFQLYLISLKDLVKSYKGTNDRFGKVLALYERYNVYRQPVNSEESERARSYLASIIYAHKSKIDDPYALEPLALEANSLAWDKSRLDKNAWYIENELGNLYCKVDNYSKALYYYRQAENFIKTSGSKEQYCRLHLNIANCQNWLGQKGEAVKLIENVLTRAKKEKLVKAEIAAYEKLCKLSLQYGEEKEYEQYSNSLKELLNRNKILSDYESRRRTLLEMDGEYFRNLGDHKMSIEKLKTLLKILESDTNTDRTYPKTLLDIAKSYKATGDVASASRSLEQAENFFEGRAVDNTLVDIYMERSGLVSADYEDMPIEEQIKMSISYLKHAADINRLINEKFVYSKAAKISTERTRGIIEKILGLFHEGQMLDSKFASYEEVREVFNWSKNRLSQQKSNLNQALIRLDTSTRSIADSLISRLVSAYDRTQMDEKLEQECFRIKSELAALVVCSGIEEQSMLGADYVEFVCGEDYIYTLTRIAGRKQFRRLDRAIFDELFSRLNRSMEQRANATTELLQLADFFSLDEYEIGDEIVFVADGPLFVFPFDILTYEGAFLIEKAAIEVQPSFILDSDQLVRETRILLHKPIYEKAGIASTDRAGVFHLPFAEEEVAAVGSYFNSSSVIEQVESKMYSDLFQETTIYHYAGHAKVKGDSAYLYLGSGSQSTKITFDQIQNQSLELDLVTLSACETGLGAFVYGDGINSLGRSFKVAGAKAVLSSLWTVNDKSTAGIMKHFYRNLKEGKEKHIALREAKLEFLKSASPDYKHPYFWAGFAIEGSMSPLNDDSLNYPLLVLITIFLTIIFMFIKRKP